MISDERKREIRQRAEEQVRKDTDHPAETEDTERLTYELRVHQIELEMQNQELQRSEAEIEQARERYQLLFDRAPVAYLVLSPEGVIREANHAAAELLGAEEESLVNKPIVVFVDSSYHRPFFDHLKGVFSGVQPGPAPLEMEITARGGARRWGRAESGLQIDRDGSRWCLMAVTDITERRRIEDDLRIATEEAVAANAAKSMFLANMSHEVRTPMNGVLALTELVLDSDLEQEQREYLEKVYSSARSLLSVIDDVLDLSKIEANKLSITNGPYDIDQILEHLKDLFKQLSARRTVTFSVRRSDDLPPRLVGDRDRVRQILVNLLSNAVKFTEDGTISVVAYPAEDGSKLFVDVRDTGTGIGKEDRERIFESFTQADGTYSRRHGGAGLGLSISRQLARRMAGDLTFEGSPGQGSLFRLTLPLIEPRDEPLPEEPVHEAAPLRPGARVLVAEDNGINALVLRKILEKSGLSVDTVRTGTEALDAVARHDYEVVLMDISMPGMDGITATRHIRAGETTGADARVPIIAITAHAMKGDRERFIEAGMNGYIAKPFTRDGVLASIREIIATTQ